MHNSLFWSRIAVGFGLLRFAWLSFGGLRLGFLGKASALTSLTLSIEPDTMLAESMNTPFH